jgi:hypothetical protein
MRRPALAATTIAMTIALSAALAGCTTSPSPAPDDKQQALERECLQFRAAIDAAKEDVNTATATLFDEPDAAAAQVIAGATAFGDAVGSIRDEELRAVSEPISDAMVRFGEAVTAHAADPSEENAGAVVDIGDEISDGFAAIGDICG